MDLHINHKYLTGIAGATSAIFVFSLFPTDLTSLTWASIIQAVCCLCLFFLDGKLLSTNKQLRLSEGGLLAAVLIRVFLHHVSISNSLLCACALGGAIWFGYLYRKLRNKT